MIKIYKYLEYQLILLKQVISLAFKPSSDYNNSYDSKCFLFKNILNNIFFIF